MTDEIWKDIDGYEGYYQVSNYGNVLSVKRNKFLKPAEQCCGYYKISFRNTIRYEKKNANVMVMYSDGDNIIPKINGDGTVNITVNDGNSVFKFTELTDTTNTYTL